MKNFDILEQFTNLDLLNELLNREVPVSVPVEPFKITPYEIMVKMINNGWKENPNMNESDPRIDKIWNYLGYPKFTDDQSYCAATVNVCLKLAGYETSKSIPVARSFENYGSSLNYKSYQEGDIIVFKNVDGSWQGHVGFVSNFDEDENIFLVASGNQDNKMCFKNYFVEGNYLELSCIRRITDKEKVKNPDYKTLKDWGLL